MATASDRLAMCQLAVVGDELFEVDDLELTRPGPSYTVQTARELRQRGWPEVAWLIGADMARSLPQWHDAASLLREVRFILMARPGWSFNWADLPPGFRYLQEQQVPSPLIDISSTEIRRRIAAGLSVRYMTPPGVADYIAEKGLYGIDQNAKSQIPSPKSQSNPKPQ